MGQFQDLKAQAAIIRDEQNSYQNTSLRVGRMFIDILEQLEKVLPDENVKPETLTVEATETSYKLKFSTLTSDGSVKSRELDLPIATDTKAGVMSPALMKGIKDQISQLSLKVDSNKTDSDNKIIELNSKIGESITESYTSSPNAAWHFNGKLPKSKFFARYSNTSGDVASLRIFADGQDINQTLTKDWKYFDLSEYSSIKVYTQLTENTDISVEILEESILLKYINELLESLNENQTKFDDFIKESEKSAIPFILAGSLGKYLCYGCLKSGDDIKFVTNGEGNNNICIWEFPCKAGQKIIYRGYAYWNALIFVNNEGEKTIVLDVYNASTKGDYEYDVQEDGLLYSWSVINYGDRLQYPFIYLKDEESVLLRILDIYTKTESIDDLSNRINKLEQNSTIYKSVSDAKTWESKTTYSNARPFSINITDYILNGISPIDFLVEFDTENKTIGSIFIEYGSSLGGNKVKNQVPLLLSTEENKNFYRLTLPELSDLAISGDLTKYIVTCQISGDATEETPHKVNLTNFSYKEYLATSLEELDKRVEVLEQTSNDSLDTAINYAWRGYDTMKHVTVKKDGSGDFTTIQDAINSIKDASPSNQYDVQVWDDFYITDLKDLYKSNGVKNTEDNPTSNVMLFKMKNWVHVRGMGRRRVLSIVSPDSLAGNSFQYIQVIYPEGNNILANFYICIKGGRYAIHHESGGSKTSQDYHSTTIFKDVVAEHFGNSSYTNGSSWTSCYAQANGTTSGVNWIYKRCNWIAHEKEPFYTHANKDFDEPCRLTFIECEMSTTLNKTAASIAKGCYFGDLGSNVKSVVTIKGCNFAGFRASSFGNIRGLETEFKEDSDDIRMGGCELHGYGNTPMVANMFATGTFTFVTVNNNTNIDVIGGTAYDDIWGETYKKINGGTETKGYAISIRKIYDRQASWGSNATSLYSLAYRLGNCKFSPKTLVVKVDEQDYTITFSDNYMTEDGSDYDYNTVPRFTNQDICNQINEQYPDIFTAKPSGLNTMDSFDDCKIPVLNKTGDTIPFGKLLVKDADNGYNAYKIATQEDFDKIIAISAEYINNGEIGNAILVDKALFDYAYFTGKGTGIGQLYGVSPNGDINMTSDKETAVFENIDGDTLKFIR